MNRLFEEFSFPQNLLKSEIFPNIDFLILFSSKFLFSYRLEPQLQRIKEKRDAVLCPIIDVINDENMAYMYSTSNEFQVGGFSWSGHFTWIPIPGFEKQRLNSSTDLARLLSIGIFLMCVLRNSQMRFSPTIFLILSSFGE